MFTIKEYSCSDSIISISLYLNVIKKMGWSSLHFIIRAHSEIRYTLIDSYLFRSH